MALRGAGDVVMLPTWDPERALDLVARYSVDIAMGATPFLSDLLDAAARASRGPGCRGSSSAGARRYRPR